MSKEEAKEILKHIGRNVATINTYDGKIWHREDIKEAREMAIETLEQEPEWIPVSERLPEKTGIYLISIGDLVTSKSFDGHNFRTESAVRFIPDAWMPLPAPFRAESEDRK